VLSIREMTNSSGIILSQLHYDAFGRANSITYNQNCDFQFAGYFFLARSGLMLSQTRPYSPSTGRWLSRDLVEISSNNNPFSYVSNAPISQIDPSGLMSMAELVDAVHRNNRSGLSDEFIICLIRNESTMNENAGAGSSPAGGIGGGRSPSAHQGLMQMGKMAVETVRGAYGNNKGLEGMSFEGGSMLNPSMNIQAGTLYIKILLNQHRGESIENIINNRYGPQNDSNYYNKIKKCEECLQKLKKDNPNKKLSDCKYEPCLQKADN